MTTGIRRAAGLGAALAFACLAGAAPARAAQWGVENLLQEFRQVKSVKARFVERKHSALLTAPLESSGTLEFEAPAWLARNVIRPAPERMTLQDDRLTIETRSGGKPQRRTMSVRDHPLLWALVECIRGTLAGDLAALNRFYRVELEGSRNKWRLLLMPSDPAVQAYLNEVRLSGSGAWISAIEITQADGDRSVMQISRDGP